MLVEIIRFVSDIEDYGAKDWSIRFTVEHECKYQLLRNKINDRLERDYGMSVFRLSWREEDISGQGMGCKQSPVLHITFSSYMEIKEFFDAHGGFPAWVYELRNRIEGVEKENGHG